VQATTACGAGNRNTDESQQLVVQEKETYESQQPVVQEKETQMNQNSLWCRKKKHR
jgi:hypothetical protein